MTDKVVLAEKDMTVHILLGEPSSKRTKNVAIRSEVLLPGQYVKFDRLPWYLKEEIEGKGVKGLRLLTEEEAIKLLEERDRLLGISVPEEVVVAATEPTQEDVVED